MSKIFIDAGHGGIDPGAVGKNSKEKDNVLKVANRLKTLLESYGHTVRLSRSTDVFLSLSERARLANNWGADYFVSLHNNAATASATGFETFIFNGPVSSKTVGFQNAIHAAILNEIGIRDRGKKRANFAVLRETKMPAALIEYAFISNTNDEKILINEVEKLAQLTANGIVNYVGGVKPVPSNPTVNNPSTATTGIATVKAPTLNLRSGPSVKSKFIRTLKKGESYKVYAEKDGWLNLGGDQWASWQNGKYMDWTDNLNVKSTPKAVAKKNTVTLPKSAKTWRTYKTNVQPVKANSDWSLTPSAFGGITYEILGRPQANVVTVNTSRGKRNIFVGPGTGAVIK